MSGPTEVTDLVSAFRMLPVRVTMGSSYDYVPPDVHSWEAYMQRIAALNTFAESVEQMETQARHLRVRFGSALPLPRLMRFTHEPEGESSPAEFGLTAVPEGTKASSGPSSRSYFGAFYSLPKSTNPLIPREIYVEYREKETVARLGPAVVGGAGNDAVIMALHGLWLYQQKQKYGNLSA